MSESEKTRREEYRKKRRKWVIVQAVAMALVAVIALGSFFLYNKMSETYYIQYTERGNIDYKVSYTENAFFEEELIDEGQAYVSFLVDGIAADFSYDLAMDAKRVGFDYSYSIGAQVLVIDKGTRAPLYSPEFELLPEKTVSANGDRISIKESLDIDYVKYNKLVKSFVDTYGLSEADSSVVVTLKVNVLSKCDEFEGNGQNSYFVSLNVPLNTETFDVKTYSSVTEGEPKVLACSGAVDQGIFLTVGIVAAVLALLLGIALVVFVYLTRNEDINYTIKVKKIVSSYRSFIQQIEGEFDTRGYQQVYIKSFVELLGIRDTIQAPVLMSENADKTCTKFFIPTSTKVLYVFEIKVENYDDLYASAEQEPQKAVAFADEAVILGNDVDMEEIAKVVSEPDVILSEIEYVPDEDDKYAVEDDEPGVEVVGVVWPERAHKNKVYRYDPNGETLDEGDIVLVPTRDAEQDREVIRKAAVAHANHRIAPESVKHPLKKIIGIIRRRVENALAPEAEENKENK